MCIDFNFMNTILPFHYERRGICLQAQPSLHNSWNFFHGDVFKPVCARYRGDHKVKTFKCSEHFRVMAFAQLTYRESLRDIETCLRVMGYTTLSHGYPKHYLKEQSRPRKRNTGLAYLCRLCSPADQQSQDALRRRATGCRSGRNRLCSGLHYHRSLYESVSLGRDSAKPKVLSNCIP